MQQEGISKQDSLLRSLPRLPHSEALVVEEAQPFPMQHVHQREWPLGLSLRVSVVPLPQERRR